SRRVSDDHRFQLSTYVPPQPKVSYREPRTITPEGRAERAARARRKRRRRTTRAVLLGAGAVVLLGILWVMFRTYQAYSHLQNAAAAVSTLQDEVRDITKTDPTATSRTVEDLQAETDSAVSAVNDPLYRAATVIPFVGSNLDALREVSTTVDSLAQNVMPSLVQISTTLQPSELAPKAGTIDLEPLQQISPLLQNAEAAVNQAREQLAGIDRSNVIGPVGDAVDSLSSKLDAAADVTGPGARIARLVPPMLGGDKPRTYLMVFQNLAEPRATGGIFGSFALIQADHGKVSILQQGASSRTLGFFDPPVAELTENQKHLYSELMAQYPQDVNFTPDFATAAPLFAEMYRLRTGTTVDGVMSIDPVALSYALKGTAPIDIGEGFTITADNVVPILLSTAYQQFDEKDQNARDDFLAHGTGMAFSEVMSGRGDSAVIFDGLRQAASERRILIYSTNPTEQADLAQTNLAGGLDENPGSPSIGVFLNDGTAAKLGYYLSNEVKVTQGQCRADGRRELDVAVTMHYDAPSSGLPAYVTGAIPQGQPYILKTNVLAFAPLGGGVVGATRDGHDIGIGRGQDHLREVGTATIAMNPGTSTVVTFTVLSPSGGDPSASVTPGLMLTPGVKPWEVSVEPYQPCSPVQN
ncbi:MAG TPA: DUF4012 domain-containing protein, partial [Nakamurella sp.]